MGVRELLQSEILEQFHSDGVSVEQSLTYEKFILEFLVVAGEASAIGGEPFSEPVRRRLLDSATHLETVTAPDGLLPQVGDCDSGRGADWGDPDPASAYVDAAASCEKSIRESLPKSPGPELVADAVEHALTSSQPKIRYAVGNEASLVGIGKRLLTDRLNLRLIRNHFGI